MIVGEIFSDIERCRAQIEADFDVDLLDNVKNVSVLMRGENSVYEKTEPSMKRFLTEDDGRTMKPFYYASPFIDFEDIYAEYHSERYGLDPEEGAGCGSDASEAAAGLPVTVTAAPSTAVTAGQSATTAVTVTPVSGFTGTVNFLCTVPSSMTGAFCSATPVQIVDTSSVTSTVTINTTAPNNVTARRQRPGLWLSGAGRLFGVVLLGAPSLRRKRTALICSLLALVLGLSFFACGGSNSLSGPASSKSATPPGTYNVTLTAISGTASHTINVNVTVQ